MKRRIFTKAVLSSFSLTALPIGAGFAKTKKDDKQNALKTKSVTSEGIELSLLSKKPATKNLDSKQFILTFQVDKAHSSLKDKIYTLNFADGKQQQVYMTRVADNQLQAVFNTRINA